MICEHSPFADPYVAAKATIRSRSSNLASVAKLKDFCTANRPLSHPNRTV